MALKCYQLLDAGGTSDFNVMSNARAFFKIYIVGGWRVCTMVQYMVLRHSVAYTRMSSPVHKFSSHASCISYVEVLMYGVASTCSMSVCLTYIIIPCIAATQPHAHVIKYDSMMY